MGLGNGTNNFVELMALRILLLIVNEKGVHSTQIFGDSMLAINWARKSQQCHNIQFLSILEEVHRLVATFDIITFYHVYGDLNREANTLSKSGLQMAYGKWTISKLKEGDHYDYYHRPFNEDLPIPAV